MDTDVMMDGISATSPRVRARIAGLLYLLAFLTGIFAQGFVTGRLVVDGDATATATNILTHRGLFELGFTVYFIEMICQIAITALFYDLLKPAGRSVSLVAAFLGLAGCVIKTFSRLFFIAPLFILGGAHYLSVVAHSRPGNLSSARRLLSVIVGGRRRVSTAPGAPTSASACELPPDGAGPDPLPPPLG